MKIEGWKRQEFNDIDRRYWRGWTAMSRLLLAEKETVAAGSYKP